MKVHQLINQLHYIALQPSHFSSPNDHVSSGKKAPFSPSIPSTNTAQQISQHYSRLLSRWPADRLRPAERHFQRLLQQRIQEAPVGQRDESREVNAAYSLLDDAIRKRYLLSESFMRPASKPEHYTALAQELDEAPDRTWFSGWVKRMKNLVRFQ